MCSRPGCAGASLLASVRSSGLLPGHQVSFRLRTSLGWFNRARVCLRHPSTGLVPLIYGGALLQPASSQYHSPLRTHPLLTLPHTTSLGPPVVPILLLRSAPLLFTPPLP